MCIACACYAVHVITPLQAVAALCEGIVQNSALVEDAITGSDIMSIDGRRVDTAIGWHPI